MEMFPEFTNPGIPFEGKPGPFPAFGNVGAPYMATLSIPGLIVGFPMWLFSTFLVSSIPPSVQPSPPL